MSLCNAGTSLALRSGVEDEDTHEIDIGSADTDRGVMVVFAHADAEESDDTDRDVEAQGTLDRSTEMFEDTGVVIVNKPPAMSLSQVSDDFTITFRHPRAGTEPAWPPKPRQPAIKAPLIRERAFKRARVYRVVNLLDTKNEKKN